MPDYKNFISLIYSIFSLNYVYIVHTYTHRYSQMVPKPFTLQKKREKKKQIGNDENERNPTEKGTRFYTIILLAGDI